MTAPRHRDIHNSPLFAVLERFYLGKLERSGSSTISDGNPMRSLPAFSRIAHQVDIGPGEAEGTLPVVPYGKNARIRMVGL